MASDNFTDTNGTALESHTPSGGGTWSVEQGAMQIQSNALANSNGGGGDNLYIHSESRAANQRAYATYVNGGSRKCGVVVRGDASANGYAFRCADVGYAAANQQELIKVVAGADPATVIAQRNNRTSVSAKIELEIIGTALDPQIDDVSILTGNTDSDYASGSAGVCGRGGSAYSRIDDWVGEDVGGGGGDGAATGFRSLLGVGR